MWKLVSVAAVALTLATSAHAASVPMEPAAFTDYALKRLKQIKPDIDARVTGQGAIGVKNIGTIFLKRIYDFCQRNLDECDDELTGFLMTLSAAPQGTAFDAAMLRAALRPADYVADAQGLIGIRHDVKVLSRPFAGDLVEVCMVDSPQTARVVTQVDLDKAHLTPDAVFKICEDNIAKAVPFPADTGSDVALGAAKPLSGDFYESSLPLLHDAWAPVAQRFGGKLLIAIPEVRVVLIGNGDSPALARALSNAAAVGAQAADRPLSVQVFRWTPTGWETASPDSL
ncbi:MAG TPA: hypothetical protein VMU08_03100 [Rhizomicrobium sp.]|nr:hypothetical protein [Rhizomicrobium sp.]